MQLNPDGRWLNDVRRIPSPNCDERPPDLVVDLVVVHGISLPPGQFGTGAVEALFQNRLDPDGHPFFREIEGLEVSAHLLIGRDGALTQFVPFDRRAWHAGHSRFEARERCNDFSIGIELEGTDDLAYTDAQYERLAAVISLLMRAWPGIKPHRVVGHSDVAPGRKTDPGPAFDWPRLRRAIDQLPMNGTVPASPTARP